MDSRVAGPLHRALAFVSLGEEVMTAILNSRILLSEFRGQKHSTELDLVSFMS